MGLISVAQCSQLLFKDKIFTVHTGGKGRAGCWTDSRILKIFRCNLRAVPEQDSGSQSQTTRSRRTAALQAGTALLEDPTDLAGQAGLSVGPRAGMWLQGCVDGSSQVLGRGAPCSAAHGHASPSQGLCCAGADGSELDLVDQIP